VKSKILAIDLDGVILKFNWEAWERDDMEYWGELMPGVIEALRRLRQQGYRLVIHTCRTNPVINSSYPLDKLYQMVRNTLEKYKIPYDEIWIGAGKPIADYYIDDRAIRFENWEQTLKEISSTKEY